ncbi:rho guanine nucleotide exchange factor 15 isoform X1 [Nerophis lumbriciformis]|uniref:rho guanine nucleotide exchange factor 15 isoform X1 n=1 Tax=Nerophis lumbriciformis TaxID=546530 RepID=UPI002ADFE0E5|nr:rho guanine nucleotide exchange factor 15-like isoform X1 [Nerophis lumbriciformis]XP_061815281.1 rho guanine nucleotide exchange factor 15-like isoform X1 [Nerophis lumbriciformis]XP_061815282.1 rho guanine nucleotide exchange factor 15-like isoform X1 [Nerophis lumbriciformis]XP_061815283.1 rho guanine nucleotide exchange factor 15-like isoform X1 [Nerophis lumbriciformis]
MSARDSAQLTASHSDEVKLRPNLPPKPTERSTSLPCDESERSISPSGVNVKRIVNKLTKNTVDTDKSVACGEPVQRMPMKKQPVIKPKPMSAASTSGSHLAPPLPKKRMRTPPMRSAESEDTDSICSEGSRSEPDGKEVEEQSAGKAEDEKHPDGVPVPSSCCNTSCSCMCHLQRPGMKLVWVPVTGEDDSIGTEKQGNIEEEKEKKHRKDCEKHVEVEDTCNKKGPEVENRETKTEKKKIHNSLDVKIRERDRTFSEPVSPFLQPAFPQQNPLVTDNHKATQEETCENIYETHICAVDPSHKKKDTEEVDSPQFTAPLPARPSKPLQSEIDSSSGSGGDDVPPLIPPRLHITQNSRCLVPNSSVEDRGSLRPSTPSRNSRTPPHTSPKLNRPLQSLPKTDLNNSSSHTSVQKNGGDDDGWKEDLTEEEPPTQNKFSSKWKSRLQNEPLYQTYRATVITKEIHQQTKTGPLPTPPQNTLWRDVPAVQESGVLENLTNAQCKYQESMFEVLTSEASYLRSLHVLTEHFLENRELKETLVHMDKKPLFSNIFRVREVSERFLKDLEDRVFENIVFSDICDIVHYHAQHNFPAYIYYVRNQIYQDKTYTSLMKNNTQFAAVINRLQKSPQCHRLPFTSFLLLPFQRITRIKMLIEGILKRTQEGTKEEQMASKALTSVSKIIDECNTEVGKMRQMEELILISKTLEFDKLKAIPIISQTRFLEKKGELQEMSRGGTLFHMRIKFNPIYLFLFNDLLVITASTVKKGAERFVVLDYAHRSLVQVQPLEEDRSSAPYDNCFTLILLENHNGRMLERLIKAPSKPDMHRWMAAFPGKEEDDVVYDVWDCPQVQCVEQYVAQQADELNLEQTEIVNIIRKTNEGWYEGIRLSDGQKGWFPVNHIVEITNEHVRRRNLKERYRVIHAASLVTTGKSHISN